MSWDRNSTRPVCTNECKKSINELENELGQSFKCCSCDNARNVFRRRNIEEVCNVELDSAEICQNHMKACEFVKNKERHVKRRGNYANNLATDMTFYQHR